MQQQESIPAAIVPALSGEWLFNARDGQVRITWTFADDGASITGIITIRGTQIGAPFALGMSAPQEHDHIYVLAAMDIRLWLEPGLRADSNAGDIFLRCRLPLTKDEYFDGDIGRWHYANPGPTPVPDPEVECRDADVISIDAPAQAADLFAFVWMKAPEPCARGKINLRYAPCAGYATLGLYQELLAVTDPGAAAKKVQLAAAFRSGPDFVSAATLATQLPLSAAFAALRCALECMSGDQTAPQLVADHLKMSAAQYLQQPAWPAEYAMVWQSLFALALTGTPADAALALQLTEIARMAQFLMVLGASPELLAGADACRVALRATPVLPDAVAPYGPSPALAGPAPAAAGGIWEVLGIGTLNMARQQLHGYMPGELAEVVNVMPRERQEVQERLLTQSSDRNQHDDEQLELSGEQQHSAASSDLSDAMHALMAAGGFARDLSKVHPEYENLDLTLSGQAYGGDARSGWSAANAAQLTQRMTEQAASQMSKRIGRQRSQIWRQLQERRQSHLIDNSGGNRLVGVYCWVDRVLRIQLEPMGQRVVLSFLINHPAQAWLAQLKAEQGIAAQPPAAPLTFGGADGKGYLQVTAATYLAYGAFYGLHDLAPPPAETLRLNASFDRVSAANGAAVVVPAGYAAVSGSMSIALADNRYNVVCAVAGMVIAGTTTSVPPSGKPAELQVNVPQSSGAAFGPLVTPAVPAQSALISASVDVAVKDLTGTIPLTVMTAAPAFVVNLELQCQRSTAGDGERAMVNWQVETYQRLWQADRTAQASYAGALSTSIAAASAGRSGALQRDALRASCLALLAGQAAPVQRALAPLLDWQAMSWEFEAWPAGPADPWPQAAPSVTTEVGSDRLMQQFLQAPAARVLLPVRAGSEAWLLYRLQFRQPWAGGPLAVPVTESCVALLEQLARPQPPIALRAPWTVRLPTSRLYLLEDGRLPDFSAVQRGPV